MSDYENEHFEPRGQAPERDVMDIIREAEESASETDRWITKMRLSEKQIEETIDDCSKWAEQLAHNARVLGMELDILKNYLKAVENNGGNSK